MASTLTEALELKRAGFVGMRGKKSDSIEVPTDDFYENNPKMLYQSKRQGKKYDDKVTTYLLFFYFIQLVHILDLLGRSKMWASEVKYKSHT